MMKVVELNALRYRWPGQTHDTINLEHLQVLQGEHVFIRGASGSGKTTLLNLLAGILKPVSGEMLILDQAMQKMSSSARDRFRSNHMGIIFQQFNLLPYLSIVQNVQLPCHFSNHRRERAGDISSSSQRLLNHLGLDAELFQRSVTRLSVGQQQRVAVARALIGSPELIIADEPTSALDTDTRDDFLSLLFEEADAQGSTIIFVSHDPYIAKHFSREIDLGAINNTSTSITSVQAS